MCGIVAALPDYDSRWEEVSDQHLLDVLPEPPEIGHDVAGHDVARGGLSGLIDTLDWLLKGLGAAGKLYDLPSSCHRLAADPRLRVMAGARIEALNGWMAELDRTLDDPVGSWDADLLERTQGLAVQVKDLLWSLGADRVEAAARVAGLARAGLPTLHLARAYLALDAVLDAVDRLEVRGRDSAGIELWITLDEADAAALPGALHGRADAQYRHRAVSFFRRGLCLVYKRASVIGRLGENVAFLRAAIAADDDLHAVLALPSARVTVVAHTRWASVGRITEANAHPVDSRQAAGEAIGSGYATAALNGDIDNHLDLRRQLTMPSDPAGITTDAKVIPTMLARLVRAGQAPAPALAECLRRYHGSVAIAATSDDAPDQLLLAVKGSGQGLYVGFATGCFLIASEVYGLVGWTDRYLRLDGTGGADGEAGSVVALHRSGAGTLAGLHRFDVLGRPCPVAEPEISTAEITTRDVARGGFDHYLEKEIAEAPSSFRKSLRGRITDGGERLQVTLGESALPRSVRDRFADGRLCEIVFVGQGTAAVACRGIANVVRQLLHPAIAVDAMPATELSAWNLRTDMSSVCLVAVSQSGSTTDTNRAVDMARSRGAAVLAIVNRRDSDLSHKADGVLYTSDGRDVEMAVASTKAFYAQAATGALLGLQIAGVCGRLPADVEDSLLRALVEMPRQLEALRGLVPRIASVASAAMRYPHWAVIGSGLSRVAAEETRIKLSELCYRTISTDAVEDKKHIDLSAEAFVLVCAAGAPPGQIRDLTKEVDIFAAHRNAPMVIVDEGVGLPWATDWVVQVPAAHPTFAWILSTAVGHLFAYHTARAIDREATPLREALAQLEACADEGSVALGDLDRACEGLHQFLARATQGAVRGVLTSDVALRLSYAALLLRHGALVVPPLPAMTAEPIDFVREQLAAAVDELTRSIDSVKHQAKTVTVGTSRDDADLLDNPLARAVTQAGGDPSVLSYPVLLTLRAFSRVVAGVGGTTRYQVRSASGRTTVRVTRKTGVAETLRSRADDGADLSGSKRLAVQSRTVQLVRGVRDGRLVLMIPEQMGAQVPALTLVHLELRERADAVHLVELLDVTGNRLEEIRAAVTETDSPFDPALLAQVPVETVLLASVDEVTRAVMACSGSRG